jgi:hypothetical protein
MKGQLILLYIPAGALENVDEFSRFPVWAFTKVVTKTSPVEQLHVTVFPAKHGGDEMGVSTNLTPTKTGRSPARSTS